MAFRAEQQRQGREVSLKAQKIVSWEGLASAYVILGFLGFWAFGPMTLDADGLPGIYTRNYATTLYW
jgi:hypothetical protein